MLATTGITICTKAALGESVPANPPDSFQASGWPATEGNAPPLTTRPTSWLKPAWAVNRSALPLRMANELTDGVKLRFSLVLSIGCHVKPLLPVREYWLGLHALNVLGAVAPVGVAVIVDDSGPTPNPLTAATENENVLPLGRPSKLTVVAGGAPLTVFEPWIVHPSRAVTTYEVTELPPSKQGALQLTDTDWSPGVALVMTGAVRPDKFSINGLAMLCELV